MSVRVVPGRKTGCRRTPHKAGYRNRRAALRGAEAALQRHYQRGENHPPLYVYRCPSCPWWHLTKYSQGGDDV